MLVCFVLKIHTFKEDEPSHIEWDFVMKIKLKVRAHNVSYFIRITKTYILIVYIFFVFQSESILYNMISDSFNY